MIDKKVRYIYGIHAVSNIIHSDHNKIKKIYLKKNYTSKNLTNLVTEAVDAGLYTEEVNADKLSMLCESNKHQGVVCEIEDIDLSFFNLDNYLLTTKKPFILILDQIKANAVGCNLIIKRKSNSSPVTPAVHKASCGGTSSINIYESNDLNGILKKLKKHNITIIGTDHRAKSSYREMSQQEYIGVCIVMGSEDIGISRSLKNSCDIMCSIPIHGSVACLNISVACGVILYEVAKHR